MYVVQSILHCVMLICIPYGAKILMEKILTNRAIHYKRIFMHPWLIIQSFTPLNFVLYIVYTYMVHIAIARPIVVTFNVISCRSAFHMLLFFFSFEMMRLSLLITVIPLSINKFFKCSAI